MVSISWSFSIKTRVLYNCSFSKSNPPVPWIISLFMSPGFDPICAPSPRRNMFASFQVVLPGLIPHQQGRVHPAFVFKSSRTCFSLSCAEIVGNNVGVSVGGDEVKVGLGSAEGVFEISGWIVGMIGVKTGTGEEVATLAVFVEKEEGVEIGTHPIRDKMQVIIINCLCTNRILMGLAPFIKLI